jgi:hypothetical protein
MSLLKHKDSAGDGEQSKPVVSNDRELNPIVSAKFTASKPELLVAAAARESPAFRLEYEEFCEQFSHRPGMNLMRDYVVAEDDRRLVAWLDWRGEEPEAKAFIRLMLAMIRAGEQIWDQPGITMFRQGGWLTGGVPSVTGQEALSVMAQLIGKRIRVLYKESRSAPDAEMRVLRFEP